MSKPKNDKEKLEDYLNRLLSVSEPRALKTNEAKQLLVDFNKQIGSSLYNFLKAIKRL